ncbi:MAG: malto-oligosyltrehalose trehalohydrolase [Cyanobacteriota bacterium]|nr:malto-oligosyltrehalose trehalohydrolase [Cyanobacteriota bacterium]
MRIGANYLGDNRCEFTVWSPIRENVAVQIEAPKPRLLPLQKDERGYWRATATDIPLGTRYRYQLAEDTLRPDPASYCQPNGVHQASQVVEFDSYTWQDANWQNLPLEDYIAYELHVGTFTPEGTFEGIIPYLSHLKDLGINAIELMPIAQFPGDRNWGYDGVYPFAVQQSYGGIEGLQHLVDACHDQGFAVILDVVYNHFGPEGNYTANFGPYFTANYRTPWGSAINFDDAYSDGVRNFCIENALFWLREFHIDALRLDAVHAIYDFGAEHFLKELAERVETLSQQQNRPYYLIAESDLNDTRIIRPQKLGGYGIDAQWSDDFHHSLHTLLTGESSGYYEDFGRCEQFAKVLKEGYAYTWDYSPHRQRYHGSQTSDRAPSQFVVCSQNHDQIGNRMLGERLSHLVSFEALKLAAGAVLLSPYIPMLFMGEEYGETAPFLYFISHGDPNLVAAVREGRKQEFAAFHLEGEPPDAQSEETFLKSKLNWKLRAEGQHQVLLNFYKMLIQLRHQIPALKTGKNRENIEATSWENESFITLRRWHQDSQIFCIMNFAKQAASLKIAPPPGNWQKQLDSADSQWLGAGSSLPNTLSSEQNLTFPAESFALYQMS